MSSIIYKYQPNNFYNKIMNLKNTSIVRSIFNIRLIINFKVIIIRSISDIILSVLCPPIRCFTNIRKVVSLYRLFINQGFLNSDSNTRSLIFKTMKKNYY